MLAVEAREGPNNQDRAGRLVVAIGDLFQDVMAIYHPHGIAGDVASTTIQHPVGVPAALEEIRCGTSLIGRMEAHSRVPEAQE